MKLALYTSAGSAASPEVRDRPRWGWHRGRLDAPLNTTDGPVLAGRRLGADQRHDHRGLRLGSKTVSVVCERRAGPGSPAVLEDQLLFALHLEVVHPLGDEVFEIAPGMHILEVG